MELTEDMVFKFLAEDGSAFHGGSGKWDLPNGDKPGKWTPKLSKEIKPGSYGYHLYRRQDLLVWFAPRLFVAEYSGTIVEDDNKIVVPRARLIEEVATWNIRTIVLFVCDCAEHSLSNFERVFPDDKRPRNAINTARLFVGGKATISQAWSAWSAAESAWSAESAWITETEWEIQRLWGYLKGER